MKIAKTGLECSDEWQNNSSTQELIKTKNMGFLPQAQGQPYLNVAKYQQYVLVKEHKNVGKIAAFIEGVEEDCLHSD